LIDINNGNNNRIFYFDYIHNNTNIKNIFENNLKNNLKNNIKNNNKNNVNDNIKNNLKIDIKNNMNNNIINNNNNQNIIKKNIRMRNRMKTISRKPNQLNLNSLKRINSQENSHRIFFDFSDMASKYSKINSQIDLTNKNRMETKNEVERLDNFELNRLDFYEAMKLDKRSFLEIYWGFLTREHPILFTFYVCNDYNLIYIKLVRFIFLLTTDMVLNVFFFSDESMHQLYINFGKYDLIQQIPQIIYSIIISRIFEIFLCYLSLTDKPIYQIKNLMLNNSLIQMRFKYKCIKIKLIIFFIFAVIFMLFYWYVVSAFCVVYKNTQISFIKDWIFSLILGMLIPFVIYLIPSSLRLCSIKNKNRKCSIILYKLSEIIPFF